ncbi:unnamed protein product [Prorocentrum cordatum]|uniref:Uncharacterized protein n=1 Tax=Prorocentrum cordatum TaxID=2364126 RepID=A0ABN9UF08_9DINO|nr:unnamed protein product [Polarella glacialis]
MVAHRLAWFFQIVARSTGALQSSSTFAVSEALASGSSTPAPTRSPFTFPAVSFDARGACCGHWSCATAATRRQAVHITTRVTLLFMQGSLKVIFGVPFVPTELLTVQSIIGQGAVRRMVEKFVSCTWPISSLFQMVGTRLRLLRVVPLRRMRLHLAFRPRPGCILEVWPHVRRAGNLVYLIGFLFLLLLASALFMPRREVLLVIKILFFAILVIYVRSQGVIVQIKLVAILFIVLSVLIVEPRRDKRIQFLQYLLLIVVKGLWAAGGGLRASASLANGWLTQLLDPRHQHTRPLENAL